ncbi:hypothetical protein LUZ63_002266 [Rhynchospora breviuscula]|uniref:DUF1664 domain-containing protein n=1 Tax=Rhynchospora breviuscula TaxID=2022672 RepID=A0A9Q0CZF7_9POAL|nr:hypothetical protein LUZ63_002266 [Rhynchospora breviuscula]
MAMHSGAATSKVLIALGTAGLAGSIVLRNGQMSDVLAQILELVKGVNEGEVSPGHIDMALLAAQIRHLAQEVRDLTASKPVTILTGDSASRGKIASFILPAAAIGAVGYCYMKLKGLSFSDVMFVTKQHMATAVASVSKQLEQVSDALAATKRHLTQRLENLDGKIDEQREVSKAIMNEVNDVKTDLSQIGFDIESIQQMVAALEGKVGLLENKQDVANAGIWYLCQVAGGIKDGIHSKFFEEASEKLKPSHALTFSEATDKLKGLHILAEDMKPEEAIYLDSKKGIFDGKDSEKPAAKGSFPTGRTIHRTYTSNLTSMKQGFVL